MEILMLSVAIIFLVILIIAFCHLMGPRATVWMRSPKEEKIGLSKNRLFNANGYLVQSNSEILLGSRGSFKRFESVDRDASQYKSYMPPWSTCTFELEDKRIPPPPMRPAPIPPTPTSPIIKLVPKRPQVEDFSRQYSLDHKLHNHNTSPIPRPQARKQLSAPTACQPIPALTPPNTANSTRSPLHKTASTNPFLNGSLEEEVPPKSATNPFIDEPQDMFNFDTADPLRQCEERITRLEAFRRSSRHSFDESDQVLLDNSPSKTDLLNHIREMSSSLDSTIAELTKNLSQLDPLSTPEKKTSTISTPSSGQLSRRGRSLSETHVEPMCWSDNDNQEWGGDLEYSATASAAMLNSTNNNPFCMNSGGGGLMQKTASDLYLEQYSLGITRSGKNYNLANAENLQLQRQGSFSKLNYATSSSPTSSITSSASSSGGGGGGERGHSETSLAQLKRTISTESVSSESSVVLGDLERDTPPVTGQLCLGLQYDKNNATEEGCDLYVTVLEAKNLVGPDTAESMDTFVRIYLVPDEKPNLGPLQTKIFKSSKCPSYQETFSFWIDKTKNVKRSLWFHLYHTSSRAHTLIGETEMKLTETSRPITTWLQLTDSRHNNHSWGELMFSLSYLPTAERLTVVVVKARNLKLPPTSQKNQDLLQNVFVKVYLLKNDKKVSKKKTSVKRDEKCPIFNEAMIFSVPPYMLNSIQVRLTVVNVTDGTITPIGHVIVGSGTSGKGLRHWHQMLTTSLRKPVAMWHALRMTHSVTGGAKGKLATTWE